MEKKRLRENDEDEEVKVKRLKISDSELRCLHCQPKEFYCQADGEIICSNCKHSAHRNHHTTPLTEHASFARKKATAPIKQIQQSLQTRKVELSLQHDRYVQEMQEKIKLREIQIQELKELEEKMGAEEERFHETLNETEDHLLDDERSRDVDRKVESRIGEILRENNGFYSLGEFYYEQGYKLLIDSRPHESVIFFKKSAKAGFLQSWLILAALFEHGNLGIPFNDQKADTFKQLVPPLEWFKEENARCKTADSRFFLALRYGQSSKFSDEEQAAKYFKKAADEGHTLSEFYYGLCNRDSEGFTEPNPEIAFVYFKKAAEKGFAVAQHCLGWSYRNGEGVEKDLMRALHYLSICSKKTETAKEDYAALLSHIGVCYASGTNGLEKDQVLSIKFCQLGADFGRPVGTLEGYVVGSRTKCEEVGCFCLPMLLSLGGDLLPELWRKIVFSLLDVQCRPITKE